MRVLIIGPSGLADLGLALYLNAESVALPSLTLTETAIGGGISHYDVDGLPAGVYGQRYTLTWAVGGQWGVFRWPTQAGSPDAVVIPLRASGAVVGDLDLHLYLDGEPESVAGLELEEVGEDYRITGLPEAPDGSEYRLAYSYGGSYSSIVWPDVSVSTPATLPLPPVGPLVDPMFRNAADIMAGLFAESVTLRRPLTLRGRRSAVPALEFNAAALAGATSIVLREQGEGPAMLTGLVPRGTVVTIDGNAHVVQADAAPSLTGTVTLSILPALEGPMSLGDNVTISSTVTWTVLGRVRTRKLGLAPGSPLRDKVSFRVAVPLSELDRVGTITPEAGWTVTDSTGRTGQLHDHARKRGCVALLCG